MSSTKRDNERRELLKNPEKLKSEIEFFRNAFFYHDLEESPELIAFNDRLLDTAIAFELQNDETDMLEAAKAAAQVDPRGYKGTLSDIKNSKLDKSLIPYIEKYTAIVRLIGAGKRTKALENLKQLYDEYRANTDQAASH